MAASSPAAPLRHQLAEVVVPGESLQARLPVQGAVDVGQRPAPPVVEVRRDGRVEVAGPGPHHQALQRGQAHRGVHGLATAHGRRGGAVAQVQHDQVASARAGVRAGRRRRGRRRRGRCRGSRSDAPGGPRARPAGRRRCRRRAACVWWKAVSKTATCGTSGKFRRATRRPSRLAGLCSGARGTSSVDGPEQVVVDQGRCGEDRAPVDHAVSDRGQADRVELGSVLGEGRERGREGVVDGGADSRLAGASRQEVRWVRTPADLADPLHQALGLLRTGLAVEQAVLQRRRAGVEDQDGGAHGCASCSA